ncbi:hypothetical protein NPIL_200191 [Nephila pilipes]|uniref:Uncharacterized protein n=1 Tax=Nephila pilipes TaxID=299642 RepID=A0A8X6QDM3_NEPPI|nr:hypothetical protein NPIL_200191 [Nephila pilipes]
MTWERISLSMLISKDVTKTRNCAKRHPEGRAEKVQQRFCVSNTSNRLSSSAVKQLFRTLPAVRKHNLGRSGNLTNSEHTRFDSIFYA